MLRRGEVIGFEGAPLRDGRARIESCKLPLELEVCGVQVRLREHVHLAQNKPSGVVTARKDDRHPTAWALLEGAPMHAELRAVGRLDLDATGLLLWTTDKPRIHELTHPRRKVTRTYHVALERPWACPPRDANGKIVVRLADGTRPRIVELERLGSTKVHPALSIPPGTDDVASITLLDGAYHEIKRIFAALESHVLALARVEHAGLNLPHSLGPGCWMELDACPRPPA